MNDRSYALSGRALVGVIAVAALLGALLAIPVTWAADAIGDRIDETDSIAGVSNEVAESEADLLDAVHTAAEEAVTFEGGKYKGDTFKIARIELTADNPHITAYRVVLQPSG